MIMIKPKIIINKTGFPIFAKFQKLQIGVVPNIVCIEDSPALVLDTIHDIFYPPINLHKLCCYYFGIRKNDDLYPDENYQLNSFLNGLICFSKFGENFNFPCILNGHEHSHADTVRIEHNNVEMSLKKFYRTVYNYDIKRLYWPLAVTNFNGKKHYYPLECLTVAPGQKGKLSNIDPLKIPLLHQFLKASNDTKLEEIESAPAIFQTSKNEICKRLQISFENSPLSVKAKLFSPPEIVYENASITPNSNGQWKIQTYDLKYIDGCTCENWRAVLLQSTNYSLTSINFEKFILCYCIYANCHGLMMKMEVPIGRFYKRRSDNPKFPVISIEATKEQIDKIFEEANQQFRKFLLFGYDATEVKLCSYIKWLGKKFNIITQFILIPHILEAIYNETPIIGEIIAKTNIKLGGLNYNIEIPNYDKNALFIGIHVEMPSDNLSSDNEISKFATIGFVLFSYGYH
uniref:Uncharacterized protein n=1 Tax=Panagrolaimus superbus TaxID=310955 RepID=A0A914Y8W2_9BILA